MWLCVNRDILLGLLKRVAAERKPELKVIVTSATLDGQKFSEYFFNCPVVTVPGKLYPVQLLYSVDQPVNYLDSSVQTALDIHVREPPGDILLFMTGQEEILKAISMLEERVKALEEGSCLDVEILPLYASLPPESQACYYSCLGALSSCCYFCKVFNSICQSSEACPMLCLHGFGSIQAYVDNFYSSYC
jgi:ATP-dependent RNA helicase DHX8/PRP22